MWCIVATRNQDRSPADMTAAIIPSPPLEKVMASCNLYGKPLTNLGKNQFKDEVIIRNADSGKGNFTFYWHIREGGMQCNVT